jgi:hypothetical protein
MIQVRFATRTPTAEKAKIADSEEVEVEYTNGDSYSGAVSGAVRQGEGTYTFQNGDIYVGGFDQGVFHGKGVYTNEAGDMYEGTFVNGQILGQGNATFASTPNYSAYDGFWVEGLPSGKGKLTFDLGDYYEGQFERGRFHGRGLMVYTNGDAYDGNYVDGNPQGEGQFMFKEANIVQRRRFANGVDRANTSEIKSNTFGINKKQNVQVKQFKQAEGQKFLHPKAAKKVDNSSIVAGLLGQIGGKTKLAPRSKATKALKNEKVKKVKEVKAAVTSKSRNGTARLAPTKKSTKVVSKKKSEPTVWPEYGYSYPKAFPSKPVNTQQIFNEIDNEPGIRRTRTMAKTIESARGYFQMLNRLRDAQIAAATSHVTIA